MHPRKKPRKKPASIARKSNWVVAHEFDDEPTYVLDKVNDPTGIVAIEFPPEIPFKIRLKAAKMVAAYLNNPK